MPVRDPRGQHRAVGAVLGGFGAGTVLLGGIMTGLGVVDVGFLDGPTVVVIGVVMIALGTWQWRAGLRFSDDQRSRT